ncbi:hypothetical protein EXIGLDRAFT_774255 [Exidia glandulosa HHB12029]|uniref:Uncharacterized protein n=1 Tax=Exidia glandulosa HHB12029 TaxID=1314781 RepID=A0A165EEY7_EXIGL|nr:hypothetical protein EXIGLDRAFT_774255 [Exidia glandulosa HHB12029]
MSSPPSAPGAPFSPPDRPVFGPPRPPRYGVFVMDSDSDEEDPEFAGNWTTQRTESPPPQTPPSQAPFIVTTPWYSAQTASNALPRSTTAIASNATPTSHDTESRATESSPSAPESQYMMFTLWTRTSDDWDFDDPADDPNSWDADQPLDVNEWGRLYLIFVQATRTCAARRAAWPLPPAPCSRTAPCELCATLPGMLQTADFWLSMYVIIWPSLRTSC